MIHLIVIPCIFFAGAVFGIVVRQMWSDRMFVTHAGPSVMTRRRKHTSIRYARWNGDA